MSADPIVKPDRHFQLLLGDTVVAIFSVFAEPRQAIDAEGIPTGPAIAATFTDLLTEERTREYTGAVEQTWHTAGEGPDLPEPFPTDEAE